MRAENKVPGGNWSIVKLTQGATYGYDPGCRMDIWQIGLASEMQRLCHMNHYEMQPGQAKIRHIAPSGNVGIARSVANDMTCAIMTTTPPPPLPCAPQPPPYDTPALSVSSPMLRASHLAENLLPLAVRVDEGVGQPTRTPSRRWNHALNQGCDLSHRCIRPRWDTFTQRRTHA